MPTVHLVDATYELFRAFFAAPSRRSPKGVEVGACRGIVLTLLYLLREEGATHVACATDHVIESFRNGLYPFYKTGEGIPEALSVQFPLVEDLMRALGLVVWPMIEFEADDALATGARLYAAADRVHICTVDKDLAQCVRGDHVVLVDRRRRTTTDEAGVIEKFGVSPAQIPDLLALVGDTADGYPGIPGFGKKTAARLLVEFGSIEAIPDTSARWPADVRGRDKLASTLAASREQAALFKRLATLRDDVPISESFEDLAWRGALPQLRDLTRELGFPDVCERVHAWRS